MLQSIIHSKFTAVAEKKNSIRFPYRGIALLAILSLMAALLFATWLYADAYLKHLAAPAFLIGFIAYVKIATNPNLD